MDGRKYLIMMDIYKGVLNPQSMEFVTEDDGMCMFDIELYKDKMTAYDLTGCTLRMLINGQQQDCKVTSAKDGKASIELLQSMFALAGDYRSELQVYNTVNNVKRLTTPVFRYSVRKSMMDDKTVAADPNYSILQKMIIDVSGASEVAKEASEKANEALTTINTQIPRIDKAVADANEALNRATDVATKTDLKTGLDTKSTVVIADTLPEVKDRIKNGFYLQNKDVIRDGLTFKGSDITNKVNTRIVANEYSISCTIILNSIPTSDKPMFGNLDSGKGNVVLVNNLGNLSIKPMDGAKINTNIIIKNGEKYNINYYQSLSKVSLSVNGINFSQDIIITPSDKSIAFCSYSGSTTTSSTEFNFINVQVYNRALSPEEIKYNFDSMGKNKVQEIEKADGTKYALSALSEDVFFDNGMNLKHAMNQFVSWKTLTMGTDGAFPSTKVADWYSDRYSILGNTVKNLLLKDYGAKTSQFSVLDSNIILKANQKYTLICNVISQTDNPRIKLLYTNSTSKNLDIVSTLGIYKSTFTNTQDFSLASIGRTSGSGSTSGTLESNNWMMVEGDYTNIPITFFIGLKSVGTTTDGKTCLSYQCNGVTNCFELPQPLRKWDKVENGVDVIGTVRVVFDGSADEIWFFDFAHGTSNEATYHIAIPNMLKSDMTNCVIDKLSPNSLCMNATLATAIGRCYGTQVSFATLYVSWDVKTLAEFRQSLSQNPITVEYQLAQPTSQEIKSTFVVTPDSNGNADIRFTDAVTPSSAEIQVAQTATQVNTDFETRVAALEVAITKH